MGGVGVLGAERRIELTRGGSPATRWEIAVGAVDPRLRALLDPYGGYLEFSPSPVLRREVPLARVVVIIGWGDALTARRAAAPGRPGPLSCFVAGLSLGPTIVEHAGTQACVELRMTPLGAYRLLGVPAAELTGRVVDLVEIWGPVAGELAARLAAAPDWASRFDLLDGVLLRALEGGRCPTPELAGAWDLLQRRQGQVDAGEIGAVTGWSRRRIAERFRDEVGLTPRPMSRLLRFSRAVTLLGQVDAPTLADVAVTSGFADQAHFQREFRALAGCTPLEHRRRGCPTFPARASRRRRNKRSIPAPAYAPTVQARARRPVSAKTWSER